MSNEEMHSCSYYCNRPDCIRRQRDELRERLEAVSTQEGFTLVPDSALRWLNGEEGDFDFRGNGNTKEPAYWWRSEFRRRIEAGAEQRAQMEADAPDAGVPGEKLALTVWRDGGHKLWRLADASYAENDPDWLCTIPFDRAELLKGREKAGG